MWLRRWQILTVLVVAAMFFAAIGVKAGNEVFKDLWSQLFWLTTGILATSFVLQALLSRAELMHRHQNDAFAFRAFAGTLLDRLQSMVGIDDSAPTRSALVSAIGSPTAFANVARGVSSKLAEPETLDGAAYNAAYIDVGGQLRTFAVNYIRLFVDSQAEMVSVYRELTDLALRWRYLDSLSAHISKSIASATEDQPRRAQLIADRERETQEAARTIGDTASCIAELATKASRRRIAFGVS